VAIALQLDWLKPALPFASGGIAFGLALLADWRTGRTEAAVTVGFVAWFLLAVGLHRLI
jgi:hypothetical protein